MYTAYLSVLGRQITNHMVVEVPMEWRGSHGEIVKCFVGEIIWNKLE